MAELCLKTIKECISAPECDNLLFAGVDSEALIFNADQIDNITYDENNADLATAITMKTHTVGGDTVSYCGFTVQQLGAKPFEGSQTEMAEGTYGNKFNHTVQLAILDNGPDVTYNIIDNLANGKFVVMLKNLYVHANGDNKYQLFGTAKGLRASSITREFWGEDNESAYIVTLVENGNPKSGVFFYDTDEATTDAAVAALKCTCA